MHLDKPRWRTFFDEILNGVIGRMIKILTIEQRARGEYLRKERLLSHIL
jgi:hypothetical protein